MGNNQVSFDGLKNSDVYFFLSYFENVSEVGTVGENCVRAFITCLCGDAFKYYFATSTVKGVLTENAKNYELVTGTLKEWAGKRRYLQDFIESAVYLRIKQEESLSSFMDKASRDFEEANISEEQKFVFLSKTALTGEDIRQFAVLHAHKTFVKLVDTLQKYEDGKQRFSGRRVNLAPGMRGSHQTAHLISDKEERFGSKSEEESKENAFSSKLAELSLMMHKNQGSQPLREIKPYQDVRRMNYRRNEEVSSRCAYCHSAGHKQEDCWKKQRDGAFCSYCRRRGHEQADCWAKQKEKLERKDIQQHRVNVLHEAEKEELLEPEVVAGVRRGRNSEPLPKQKYPRNGVYLQNVMQIEILIGRRIDEERNANRITAKEKKRVTKEAKDSSAKILFNRVEQYDVVNGIAQANAGINVGQLVRGVAAAAATMARKIFRGKIVKHLVAAIKKREIQENLALSGAIRKKNDPNKLKLESVYVYGTTMYTLFDSGAIPDVMSTALCSKLHLTPSDTKRRITMVDSKEAVVIGDVKRVPIKVGPITFEISCLVVQKTPYDLIICRPTMKLMRASLDFNKDVFTFRNEAGMTQIPLVTERMHEEASLTDAFATDEDSLGTGEEADEEPDDVVNSSSDELILTLFESDGVIQESFQEKLLASALQHLREEDAATIRSSLFDEVSIVAWKLGDRSPAGVPYQLSFELKDYRPMCLLMRSISLRHGEIVKQEVDNMLEQRS